VKQITYFTQPRNVIPAYQIVSISIEH